MCLKRLAAAACGADGPVVNGDLRIGCGEYAAICPGKALTMSVNASDAPVARNFAPKRAFR